MNLKQETIDAIDGIIPRYPEKRSAMLPVLHKVQADQGWVSPEAMEWVAAKLDVGPVAVYEVVTFYPFFRDKPIGRKLVRLCRTLPCALCGGYETAKVLEKELGCAMNHSTADGEVHLEWAECLASCGTGPVLMIGDDLYEHVDAEKARELAAKINAERSAMANA